MKTTAEAFLKMAKGPDAALTTVADRGSPYSKLDLITATLLDHWSYDLYSRRPGPALLENGVLEPTDLDLACFLSALASRRAVLNLPTYTSRRPRVSREGEHVVSTANRHGHVVGLSANKEVFSFSVRIHDVNVVVAATETEGDKVGAFRNFMLVDLDGTWHEGWKKIEFLPTAKENDFLEEKSLWTNSTVVFKNFVHPNRWISLYGQYYFLTKALIERLEDENRFNRLEEKRLLAAGFTYPTNGEGAKKTWPETHGEGESEAITVTAFEAEVDVPWSGQFAPWDASRAGLLLCAARIRMLQYDVLPRLRFATRATELAFYQAGMKERSFPAWIKGAKWEDRYVQPKKRKEWTRLVLAQLFPGQLGLAIRYRTYEKTERVAAGSEGT